MKNKISIIIGVLLILIGGGMMAYAATRDDFDIDNVLFTDIELEEKLYNADEVDSISFIADVDNLIILRTEREDIKITGKKGDNLEYIYNINKDNTLVIRQKTKGILGNFIDFNIFGTIGIANKEFIIELPNTFAGSLKIELDAGEIEIKDYETDNININLDAGSIKLENVTADRFIADVDAGKVTVNNSILNVSEISVDAGDVDVTADIMTSLNIEVDAGDIDLVLLGGEDKYTVNGRGNGSVRINTDVDAGDSDYSFQD